MSVSRSSIKYVFLIRRTDKAVEAGPTLIEEYMEMAEMWFRKYEMSHPPTKRRIYLATDEPNVIREKYLTIDLF